MAIDLQTICGTKSGDDDDDDDDDDATLRNCIHQRCMMGVSLVRVGCPVERYFLSHKFHNKKIIYILFAREIIAFPSYDRYVNLY